MTDFVYFDRQYLPGTWRKIAEGIVFICPNCGTPETLSGKKAECKTFQCGFVDNVRLLP